MGSFLVSSFPFSSSKDYPKSTSPSNTSSNRNLQYHKEEYSSIDSLPNTSSTVQLAPFLVCSHASSSIPTQLSEVTPVETSVPQTTNTFPVHRWTTTASSPIVISPSARVRTSI